MTGELERYRARVSDTVERALLILAQISYGDLDVQIEPLPPDDDFADLLYGLQHMLVDVVEARREIDEQSRHNLVRAELWKTALLEWESNVALARALLALVGPRFGAVRASYWERSGDSTRLFHRAEWRASDVPPLETGFELYGAGARFSDHGTAEVRFEAGQAADDDPLSEIARRQEVGSVLVAFQSGAVLTLGDRSASRVWTDEQRVLLSEATAIIATRMAQLGAEQALREANTGLEAQVRARTVELERANERLAADISRREQAEAQVRESEAKYRGLVETSPDPILLTDVEGAIVMVNPAACVAFRARSAAALIAEPIVSLVLEEDRPRGEQHLAALRTGGGVRSAELTFERTDKTSFLAEIRSCRVEDGPGGRPLALSIVRDVTEKRERELEALRAQKLQSVGTLAGGIAHDFNNVLTSITGALQVAARYTAHQPAVAELVSSAIDAAFRATGLTKQLLTFAKGGAPVKSCMRLHEVVERAVSFCLRGSSVKSKLDLPADLWPVEVDHGQIEQAIVNLVINAKQAMPSGGLLEVSGENVMAVHPDEDGAGERRFVRIAFRDTGVGIPAENLQKIFDPYFTTKDGGTGLGLATTYFVVKQHAGFVRCESAPGRGSTFHVFLPASDRTPSVSSQSSRPIVQAKGRILVMDDDPKVRAVVELILRDVGYETVGTASGTDALEVYQRERSFGRPFAVVIMDLTVPGGDGGKETIGKLLVADKDARVVVVSGYSDDPVLADHRRYGFAGMLTKPFRAEALLLLVQSLAGHETVGPGAEVA